VTGSHVLLVGAKWTAVPAMGRPKGARRSGRRGCTCGLPARSAEVRRRSRRLNEPTAEASKATGWLQETKTFAYNERATGHTVTGPVAQLFRTPPFRRGVALALVDREL
jgi:hypothetical protein